MSDMAMWRMFIVVQGAGASYEDEDDGALQAFADDGGGVGAAADGIDPEALAEITRTVQVEMAQQVHRTPIQTHALHALVHTHMHTYILRSAGH